MKKILQSIGISLLYLLFFLGIQSIVMAIPVIPLFVELMKEALRNPLTYFDSAQEMIYSGMRNVVSPALIASDTLTLVALFFIFKDRKRNMFDKIHLKRTAASGVLLTAAMGISLNLLISYGLELLPIPQKLLEDSSEMENLLLSGNMVVNFIAIAVIGPVLEEVIFRGCMFTTLKRNLPVTVAAVVQAGLFGLAHGNPISIGYAFLLGLILAFVFVRTGSLWVPIALHMAFNATSLLLGFVPDLQVREMLLIVCLATIMTLVLVFVIRRKKPN